MKQIDLTLLFEDNMPVYPGDPASELRQTATFAKDGLVHYELHTPIHAGTHMDAPLHMVDGGKYLSDYLLEKFFGHGVLVDARGKDKIDADLLNDVDIKAGDIVLILTGFGEKYRTNDYYENYPELTLAFAKGLVAQGASMIGMDSPSPDREPYLVHKELLGHDVLIIENLCNLESLLGVDQFDIIALPTKLHAEAAPVRVVAQVTN